MKNFSTKFLIGVLVVVSVSACHPTHFVVGNGPQQHQVVSQRNKFLLLGTIPVGTPPDPNIMSNHAKDYTIRVKLTFADVLLNVITFGIYSPLTVTVEY